MKNKFVKRMLVLLLTSVMALSMTACGNEAEEAAVVEETQEEEPAEEVAAEEAVSEEAPEEETKAAEGTLTEDEYLTEAERLMTDISSSMEKLQADISQMDTTDADGFETFAEKVKAPYVELAALQAPELYAGAQAKFKSGSEAMIEYLDICVELVNPETAASADSSKLTELLTVIQNDFTEGSAIMEELTGGAEAAE